MSQPPYYHQPETVRVCGPLPVAKRLDDPDRPAPDPQAAAANARALKQHNDRPKPSRWRSVRMPAYHALGDAIAFLEAVERGDEDLHGDADKDPLNVENVTTAEDLACLRGACLRVLDATELSLEQARKFKPRRRQDLTLVAVSAGGPVELQQRGLDRTRGHG